MTFYQVSSMQAGNAERWIVSRYAVVSWQAGRIEIASPPSEAIFQTDNSDILRLLHAFARARTVQEVAQEFGGYLPSKVAACIHELIASGTLVNAAAEDTAAANCWAPSALAFHTSSRNPRLPPSPAHITAAVVEPPTPGTIPLGPPARGKVREFADVLESRRSSRAWPKRAIAFETFSSLLWLSARNRDRTSDAPRRDYVNRPYPSGGAAYSIEVYPVISPGSVEAIPAGVYRYLPESHGLEARCCEAMSYAPFTAAAGRSAGSVPPPVVLIMTSRFARQGEAYGDLAYSLVLKEVGALFQTLYLVAGYLELAACALGGGTPGELLARICNLSQIAEPVVGEFMVGPR